MPDIPEFCRFCHRICRTSYPALLFVLSSDDHRPSRNWMPIPQSAFVVRPRLNQIAVNINPYSPHIHRPLFLMRTESERIFYRFDIIQRTFRTVSVEPFLCFADIRQLTVFVAHLFDHFAPCVSIDVYSHILIAPSVSSLLCNR